ncbi:MAG: ATP-binding protein [Gemmatimonadetes bacterium]|nr:ATP-binding protein [Gemmatimonadota bacterium]
MVVNLLPNAVKFTEPWGRIQVMCEAGAPGAGSGGWVFVNVQDSGVGIAADQLEAIFAPFV